MEKYNFSFENFTLSGSLKDNMCKLVKGAHSPNTHAILNLLKMLDEYRAKMNEMLITLIESQNVEGALGLYYEKQKIASVFLKSPHRVFLSGRAAILDCLWVKHGNISYGTSRTNLIGAYM